MEPRVEAGYPSVRGHPGVGRRGPGCDRDLEALLVHDLYAGYSCIDRDGPAPDRVTTRCPRGRMTKPPPSLPSLPNQGTRP